jgi:hypothetical protein
LIDRERDLSGYSTVIGTCFNGHDVTLTLVGDDRFVVIADFAVDNRCPSCGSRLSVPDGQYVRDRDGRLSRVDAPYGDPVAIKPQRSG